MTDLFGNLWDNIKNFFKEALESFGEKLMSFIESIPLLGPFIQSIKTNLSNWDFCQDYQNFQGGWLQFPALLENSCNIQIVKAAALCLLLLTLVFLASYISIMLADLLYQTYLIVTDCCRLSNSLCEKLSWLVPRGWVRKGMGVGEVCWREARRVSWLQSRSVERAKCKIKQRLAKV